MKRKSLSAARPNRDFGTDEKRIRTEITVMDRTQNGLGGVFLHDHRLCADGFIVRTQSAIRADGTPSAPVRRQCFQLSTNFAERPLRALRANPVFHTDEKHIRMENRVIDKSKNRAGLVLIQDCRLCADGALSAQVRRQQRPWP